MTEKQPVMDRLQPVRELDMESLKALSHPLRVQIFDALSVYGAATASGLAERLGESSGATSYHLRQLEKHGFVREEQGRGTGRERWWERVPGSINIGGAGVERTPAGRMASQLIVRELRTSQQRLLNDYTDRGADELSAEWYESGELTSTNTRLTVAQLRELVGTVTQIIERFVVENRGRSAPGARPVHIDFNAFPVVDAATQPEGEAP